MRMAGAVPASALVLLLAKNSKADTIGFAEAVDQFATNYGKDIAAVCKQVNLGDGRM